MHRGREMAANEHCCFCIWGSGENCTESRDRSDSEQPKSRRIAPGTWLLVAVLAVQATAAHFTIPENKLLNSEFAVTRWGGSVVRTNPPTRAVQFSFTGLGSGGTGLKDDYPADTVYGQILPSHGNGRFINYTAYALRFENLDDLPISVSIFMNTGFTGPSGTPPSTAANDTFWQSPWVEIPSGHTRVVRLDFNNVTPWNIQDNPLPHTQGTNGVPVAINDFDRTEVSAIGFEVAGPGGNTEAVVRISPVDCPIEMKGVSYTAWSQDALSSPESDVSLGDARNLGCNWAAICIWWFQDGITSTVIEPDYTRYSATPESVANAIQDCHRLGMRVMLKPMVDCRDGNWRGYIQPSSEWFTAYRSFLNYWADIAEQNAAEMFCIGCELVQTTGPSWAAEWRETVNDVRLHYDGPLIYAANHGEEDDVNWWDAIDYIGIDAYYSLTAKTNPTLDELKSAWQNRANSIETWRNGNWPKLDVIFTEVGYQSVDGTNITPWWTNPASPLDLQEQADCYEALLSQCRDRRWWKGAFWWNWETDPDAGGPTDPYHPMQNKPAEDVLRKYYTSFVDANSPNDPGSGIQTDPFRRIQDAINQASDGDILLLAAGTYMDVGDTDLNFQGKSLCMRSAAGPGECVIDCNGSQNQPRRGIIFHSGETEQAIVEGIGIIKGWVQNGGAISFDNNSSPSLTNCILAGNNAARGGGLFVQSGTPRVSLCTITGNIAAESGGGIYCESDGLTVINSIIWGNQQGQISGAGSITYSDVEGGHAGLGNIDVDPCFANFSGLDEPNEWDLHLRSEAGRWEPNTAVWLSDNVTSRCIDAGDPSHTIGIEPLSAENLRVNIGAYGATYQASKTPLGWALLCDLNNDGVVDFSDFSHVAASWLGAGTIGDVNRDGLIGSEDIDLMADDWVREATWK